MNLKDAVLLHFCLVYTTVFFLLLQWSSRMLTLGKTLISQVEIPGDQDTTYWCVVRQIPQDVLQQQHYIYMVRFLIVKASTQVMCLSTPGPPPHLLGISIQIKVVWERERQLELAEAASMAVISRLSSAPLPWVHWLSGKSVRLVIWKVPGLIPSWIPVDFSFSLSKTYIHVWQSSSLKW